MVTTPVPPMPGIRSRGMVAVQPGRRRGQLYGKRWRLLPWVSLPSCSGSTSRKEGQSPFRQLRSELHDDW